MQNFLAWANWTDIRERCRTDDEILQMPAEHREPAWPKTHALVAGGLLGRFFTATLAEKIEASIIRNHKLTPAFITVLDRVPGTIFAARVARERITDHKLRELLRRAQYLIQRHHGVAGAALNSDQNGWEWLRLARIIEEDLRLLEDSVAVVERDLAQRDVHFSNA